MRVIISTGINFKSELAEVPVETTKELCIEKDQDEYRLFPQDVCDLAATIKKCRGLRVLELKDLTLTDADVTAQAVAMKNPALYEN